MKIMKNSVFENFITKISKEIDYPFDSDKAVIFGLNVFEDNFEAVEISSGGDVYDLLDTSDIELLLESSKYDYLTVGTCGWAAPIDKDNDEYNDIPASQHPKRTRVKLFCTSNTKQIGSSVLFRDAEDKEPVNDFGNAKGSLADAFNSFVKQSFKFKEQ